MNITYLKPHMLWLGRGGGTWGGIGEEEENELKLLGIGFT